MYQKVYIDVVFAANLLMDYILLRLTGIVLKIRGSRRRCLAAAAAGALFSCLCLYVRAEMTVFTVILRIICAVVMMLLAYGIHDRKQLTGAVLFFFGMTFLTGGFWTAVSGNARVTVQIFLLCAAVSYGGLSLLIFLMERVKASRDNLYPVILTYHGQEVETCGLYDTGNLLDDPTNHAPVSIADQEMLKDILTENLIERLQKELQNAFSFIKESFGEEQEMLLFVTGITADHDLITFIAENGCLAYFQYSGMLLYNKEEKDLRKACLKAVQKI